MERNSAYLCDREILLTFLDNTQALADQLLSHNTQAPLTLSCQVGYIKQFCQHKLFTVVIKYSLIYQMKRNHIVDSGKK